MGGAYFWSSPRASGFTPKFISGHVEEFEPICLTFLFQYHALQLLPYDPITLSYLNGDSEHGVKTSTTESGTPAVVLSKTQSDNRLARPIHRVRPPHLDRALGFIQSRPAGVATRRVRGRQLPHVSSRMKPLNPDYLHQSGSHARLWTFTRAGS